MSLENLKAFEVKKEECISAEDKAFLERRQNLYENTLQFYKDSFELYKKAIDSQDFTGISEYSVFRLKDVEEATCKNVNAVHREFVSGIYGYFSRKYNVHLDHRKDFWERKYSDYYNLSDDQIRGKFQTEQYLDIVADILEQTGGMTFGDLSAQQLKDEMKKACRFRDWAISIKGSTLKYSGWNLRETWGGSFECNAPFIKVFPRALSMFLYNSVLQLPGCDFLYKYSIDLTPEQLKEGFDTEPYLKVVTKIKFFRNGRIDIKFDTPERARSFAKEWCGYVPAA